MPHPSTINMAKTSSPSTLACDGLRLGNKRRTSLCISAILGCEDDGMAFLLVQEYTMGKYTPSSSCLLLALPRLFGAFIPPFLLLHHPSLAPPHRNLPVKKVPPGCLSIPTLER